MARNITTTHTSKEHQASEWGLRRSEYVQEEDWSEDSLDSASQASMKTRVTKKKSEPNFMFHPSDGCCTGCGAYKEHSSHRTLTCTYSNYPEWFNPDKSIRWVESAQCKAYRARFGEKETMISTSEERRKLEKAMKQRTETKRRGEDGERA
jgi:hypothetical protein